MLARTVWLCVALVACGSARADDEVAAKVCPLLVTVAADMEGKDALYVQGSLLGTVVGAYDPDFQKLHEDVKTLDEETTRQCPGPRTAILSKLSMDSIAQALR